MQVDVSDGVQRVEDDEDALEEGGPTDLLRVAMSGVQAAWGMCAMAGDLLYVWTAEADQWDKQAANKGARSRSRVSEGLLWMAAAENGAHVTKEGRSRRSLRS